MSPLLTDENPLILESNIDMANTANIAEADKRELIKEFIEHLAENGFRITNDSDTRLSEQAACELGKDFVDGYYE